MKQIWDVVDKLARDIPLPTLSDQSYFKKVRIDYGVVWIS